MSLNDSNTTTGNVRNFVRLPMRTPPFIPNPLQACRNDIRLTFGAGEGDDYVVRPTPLPEVNPIDREHVAHGFDVGCLLGMGPEDGEVFVGVHGKKFSSFSFANTSERLRTGANTL